MKRVAQKQRRLSFFIVFSIFIRHRSLLSIYCILTLCQRKMSKSNRTSQSDKLDEIREQLILLNENFRETRTFFMEFLENWRQERNSTRDTVLNSLGRITSQVDELNSQMIDLPNVTLLNDTNAIWIKNEAFRIRKSMNKIWRNNLNQRKQAFWNMLKNENTSVIYVDWFSRENAIIPKKFQSKTFANEPEELKKIKEALSLEKMKAQAKLHHAVAVRNKAKFEEKGREMLNEIEKVSSVHVRQQLQELWRNDCKKQEEKSQNLWEVKKSWFKKFEDNEENIANSEDAAPTLPINQDQRRGKRRNARNRQRDGERTAAPERTTETSTTQVTGTEIPLIVEIVATESRNNEERRDNSETQFKIIVDKEVDHRKGTLTITVETTAGLVTIIVPVRIMIGAPVGQITTGGLF